ncbi:protein DA1-like [Salvia splendens]|uniref:protein DA1-like n=1 Tax=Salvia splendens TaxID=180675 RepID=UPI001C27838F|nr:protein DA1-like [Salvia splendens]XP_042006544.1 protein DA1-like [Salvia splendens]
MGWLRKILKCSDHKVLEGHSDWRYGADTAETPQSASLNSWRETEDIDHAVALSLSEDDLKGKSTAEKEPQLDDGEQLARALQESLVIDSQPESWSRNDTGNGYGYGYGYGTGVGYGYGDDNFYQPVTIPYFTSLRICAGCNMEIGHGGYVSCRDALWHPQCFRCRVCNQPLSDYEFFVSGSYHYHKTCYRESHHPKCDVCRHFIPTNATGLIEYKVHPFWSQKYCPRHEDDGTPRCCSCERKESAEEIYAALNDGRKLCLECLDSAIMDIRQCQPLFYDIHEFFKGLKMKLTQKVPIYLVEKQALNQAMGGEQHGHYHMPETRGACVSKEPTIPSRPRMRAGNRVVDMITEPHNHCEVTAILILYGLPRLLTGLILAHEMMHLWLRLNGFRGVRQDVEEGICQVIASMWLESQILSMSDNNHGSTSHSSGSKTSRFDKKLSKCFKYQIESDPSEVYGNGFRAGHQAVTKFGLQRTLDCIRKTGKFPH